MSAKKSISVTQLVRRMRNVLEIEVGELWIEGEVSNLRKQSSGHYYFSIKDEGAQMSCAMFSARRRSGAEFLEDGAKVRVFAEVTLYEARGQAQLVIQKVEAAGLGDLQTRFEELKRKLNAEGLFDSELKKPLPRFPQQVGVVTSATGAALQDMLSVLGRRSPWLKVILYPVAVQGKGAEVGIARAIEELGQPEAFDLPRVDTIIVGRGGGSLEDLWNFNEEVVARAIATCPIPIVSAVGHEIDFTIADFAADLRAPTPSAAAELVAPDREKLLQRCQALSESLAKRVAHRLERQGENLQRIQKLGFERDRLRFLREPYQRLDSIESELELSLSRYLEGYQRRLKELEIRHRGGRPTIVLGRLQEKLDRLGKDLSDGVTRQISQRSEQLVHLQSLLRALGPEAILARGYSLTLSEGGDLIRHLEDLAEGDEIVTRFHDGEVKSKVLSKKNQKQAFDL